MPHGPDDRNDCTKRRLARACVSPSERAIDDACSAQNAATQSLSQGIARHGRHLVSLFDQPGALGRFGG